MGGQDLMTATPWGIVFGLFGQGTSLGLTVPPYFDYSRNVNSPRRFLRLWGGYTLMLYHGYHDSRWRWIAYESSAVSLLTP